MKKSRVLWVETNQTSETVGGSMVSLLETARYLCNEVDLHVLFHRCHVMQLQFEALGIPYHFFFSNHTAPITQPPLCKTPWHWKYVFALVRKLRPAIVHINTSPIHAIPWVFAKFLFGFRLVVHLRRDLKAYFWAEQFVLDNVDAVICVSQYVYQDLRRVSPRLPKTEVIYDGVRDDVLRDAKQSRLEAQSLLGLDSEYRWLVIVGRLVRWKGQYRALDAMPKWQAHFPECRLAIVGHTKDDQPYVNELQKKALALGNNVLLVPNGTNRPGLWYRAAFLVLHTSDIEPFGLTVAEAIACKRPLITCAKGGGPEILNHLGIGVISSPEAFEQDVLRLLLEKEYYQKIENEAVNSKYPWTYQNTATEILNTYKQIL